MTTAETDVSKPSAIKATIRKVQIIHPKRFVYVKSTTWTKIFGRRETYIENGDITITPTDVEISDFLKANKLVLC